MNIILTDNAFDYLIDKLKKNSINKVCVYISVFYIYTDNEYVNITFCSDDDITENDTFVVVRDLKIFFEKSLLNFISELFVNFENNSLFVKIKKNDNTGKESRLLRIKALLENEINVILSQHGGFIELVNVVNNDMIIKFHGGCQGCGMVGYTLNNYIEKIIKTNFPEIKKIIDVTAHEIKDHAYY